MLDKTKTILDEFHARGTKLKNERVRFEAVTDEMADLFAKKNAKYGNSFEETLELFGIVPGVAQLHHKLKRPVTEVRQSELDIDSIRDDLIDIANYTVMMLMWMDKKEREAEQTQVIDWNYQHQIGE